MSKVIMKQGAITCIDKNGSSKDFYYRYSFSGLTNIEHRMTVYNSCDYSDPEYFELTAKEIDENTLKIVTIMKNSDALYGAKGIPDAAIPELIKLSGKNVVSSSNTATTDPNEYRSDDATKYWERLAAFGKAQYDASRDRYTYI